MQEKLSSAVREKEFFINQHNEEKMIYLDKIEMLEKENKIMTEKLINVDYFKRGISLNILQVSSSLALGLATSIIYFSILSGKDFVIYTLIQLTVFFFVNL